MVNGGRWWCEGAQAWSEIRTVMERLSKTNMSVILICILGGVNVAAKVNRGSGWRLGKSWSSGCQ